MKYYAVIDTNVLVSAMLRHSSIPGIITQETLGGRIIPLLNNDILAEYKEVLSRKKFSFDQEAVNVLISDIIRRGIFVDATPIEEFVFDPKDAVFYEVVMEVRQTNDAYLVTGNIRHFPAKHFVVTPREMLDILEST